MLCITEPQIKVEILNNKACSWNYFLIFITQKTVFVSGFSEINKRGGSNEACIVGKIFSKRIRRTPYLLETSE